MSLLLCVNQQFFLIPCQARFFFLNSARKLKIILPTLKYLGLLNDAQVNLFLLCKFFCNPYLYDLY